MTSMKDIKKMSDKDLAAFVEEKREAMRAARFGAADRNVKAISAHRKDVARALTEFTQRSKAATISEATNKA